jgi:hypothetical protein
MEVVNQFHLYKNWSYPYPPHTKQYINLIHKEIQNCPNCNDSFFKTYKKFDENFSRLTTSAFEEFASCRDLHYLTGWPHNTIHKFLEQEERSTELLSNLLDLKDKKILSVMASHVSSFMQERFEIFSFIDKRGKFIVTFEFNCFSKVNNNKKPNIAIVDSPSLNISHNYFQDTQDIQQENSSEKDIENISNNCFNINQVDFGEIKHSIEELEGNMLEKSEGLSTDKTPENST